MSKDNFVNEITNIDEDFAKWYTDIVIKAELADYTDTKGCIAIRPYGYEIWENIKEYADKKFKEIGVKNTYFPLLIPENLLQKEKDHVKGFSPEVAWVNEAGSNKLDERLCIRPTSETIIGADETYTIETLMRDGKALQSATSHYFGQNFSKPFNIKFQNKEGKEEYAYQTSWGITTRLIGAIIMAHGDDRGLKLPPKVAPIQVNIIPIKVKDETVMNKVNEIYNDLKDIYRIKIDDRDNYTVGYKFNDSEMRGIPLRIEIGPRDLENNKCIIVRRDTLEKIEVSLDDLKKEIDILLNDIHNNMYKICEKRMIEKTSIAKSTEEFEKNINNNQGFIKAMWCGDNACEEKIKALTSAKSRCIPFNEEKLDDKCFCCGKKAKHMVYFGRQY